jgi:hypothetical protein
LSRLAALAVLLVVASACGSTGTGSSPSPSPAATTPVTTPTPGLTFKLTGIKPTTGTITVTTQPGMFTVEVKITGLQPTSRHVSHVHVGSCANRGNIIYALNYVVADGEGIADTKTTLRAKYPPTSGKWYVVVHVGPDMTTQANSTYLLCGNLFK